MGGGMTPEERARRDRLKTTQSRLDTASSHLTDAESSLLESRDMGIATVDMLDDQGRRLENTRTNVVKTRAHAEDAATLVTDIRNRAWTNKFILGFVILLLVGANVAVVIIGHLKSSPKGK